ncbi:hypothetical protein ASPZODRAFT_134730 [Penicilliopsis zonata CBS 506.65]|uniref:Zn(2)-C6 fungal-type domain-containing protein n=1 Tax=Penicilliopsis zonata CBS 506.65 TaxID=1073090 RepID=A0A1L9SBR6_9EURO|nr:hypothetical protein ASPZODRAFT_134730 [Penicilliopsis zonata CBS 506.65]OJJ44650.1 hypothetical protein ASPZODRAFT_134730 [Penicilliopsis zonata CBS 506.65]
MRRVKKSRNGCARCKSKRVKCGEESPACHRCTRLGVRCPGYVQPLRWVTENGKLEEHEIKLHKTVQKELVPTASVSERTSSIDLLSQTPKDLGLDANSSTLERIGIDLDGANIVCDGLWEQQGIHPVDELTDLFVSASDAASTVGGGGIDLPVGDGSSPDDITDLSQLFTFAESLNHDEDPVFPEFSPTAIVRNYAPAAQQMSARVSIHQPLNNPSWTLIEYYFKEVAALFSSYDSQMNPFRTTVSRLWGSSLAMCRTMQSMAAASLVNDFPQFGPIGRKMRDEAIEAITNEPVIDDKSLLALLMLGQTASWHDSNDLGVSFFNTLRKHLNTLTAEESGGSMKKTSNNYRFFEEALIYWEMLLSFVTDTDSIATSDTLTSGFNSGGTLVLQRVPHPWTGIARDTQFTVHEIGRLVRKERRRFRTCRFTSQEDITQAQQAISKAQELEERLLSLSHPSEADIVSPGDDDTPVWHLLTMAEVYRCTGLMQLYRAFPDLLRLRLPLHSVHAVHAQPHMMMMMNNDAASFFDPCTASIFDNLAENLMFNNAQNASSSSSSSASTSSTSTSTSTSTSSPPSASSSDQTSHHDNWLTTFALTTLSRLKTIPLESRTRCLQPFLLVAASSELRLPSPLLSDPGTISPHAVEVSRTRKFVLARLTSFLHVLPPKPIRVCLLLVQEVWRRMDAGLPNTYWVDVMMEKGWETTMG